MYDPRYASCWRMGSDSDISTDEDCQDRRTLNFLPFRSNESGFKPIHQAGSPSFILNDGHLSLPRPPRNCGQRSTNIRSISLQENEIDVVVDASHLNNDGVTFNDSARSINASTSMNDISVLNNSASSNNIGTSTVPSTSNVGVSTGGNNGGNNPGPSTSSNSTQDNPNVTLDRPGCEISALSITDCPLYSTFRFDEPGSSTNIQGVQVAFNKDLTKRSVAKNMKTVIKRKNPKNLHDKKRLKWRDLDQTPFQINCQEVIVVDDLNTSQEAEDSSKVTDNIDVTDVSEPTDKHAELNRTLLKLLECPVCLEYMSPPIHHCKRGHLVCKNCKLRLDSCPYCRSRLCESRNLAMEQVAESLLYPCEFHNAGCKKQILLREKVAHENNCEFRIYNCFFEECHWKGQHNAMITHMNESHSSRVLNGSEHDLVISSYDIYSMNWLISVYAEVFHLNMTLKHTDFTMCVKYIGPVEKTCKYTYTINIDADQPIKRQTSFTRQVHNCTEKINYVQAMGECFYLRSDAAKLYMTEGNLNCNIQIKQL